MDQESIDTSENAILRTITVVPDTQLQLDQPKIRDAVRSAEQNYRGWPVLSLWDGDNERIEPDGLSCNYKSENLDTIFHWKIGRDGTMLHVFRLGWPEDQKDKNLPATIIVIELAEFLATICDLYRKLGFSEITTLSITVKYDNVKGALLPYDTGSISLSKVRHDKSRRFQFQPISSAHVVPISTLPEQVGPYVHTYFRELVDQHTTDLASFDEAKVTEWSLRTVHRRL